MLQTLFKTDIYIAQYPDINELNRLTKDVLQHLSFSKWNNKVIWRRPPFPVGTDSTAMHDWINDPNHPPDFLHKRDDFKNVVHFIEHHAKIYWEQLGYVKTSVPYLSNSWVMRIAGGAGGLDNHNHPNMPISGAMYFNASPAQGNIVFQDPLDLLLSMSPYLPKGRNSRLQDVEVETGKLVLFPGWLNHSVMPNTTDQTRYGMSFDIEAKPAP